MKPSRDVLPTAKRSLNSINCGLWTHYSFRGRFYSNDASIRSFPSKQTSNVNGSKNAMPPPLSVMPTRLLVRSLLMMRFLSSPHLLKAFLPFMIRMSKSRSLFLNPDRNPVLHAIVRRVVYTHFAAGENESEVTKTIVVIKKMGFAGVILGYAKEFLAEDAGRAGEAEIAEVLLDKWLEGNIRTLRMLGSGDFLAIKFTGAGAAATEALSRGHPAPSRLLAGMDEMCKIAAKQKTRIWIDAEEQIFQNTINTWTVDLMRKYNRNGDALVYNTFQAYLKLTPKNIVNQLELALKENWTPGIKLVRGAYIKTEKRDLIHDTKQQTDEAYDMIVHGLLTRSFPGLPQPPNAQLFLASHNEHSVKKAYDTWRNRKLKGEPTIKLEFGQLQGMADEVSCGLVQLRSFESQELSPNAFKCLAWGTTQECMGNMSRRVIENGAALDRTRFWMEGMKKELWRRTKSQIG